MKNKILVVVIIFFMIKNISFTETINTNDEKLIEIENKILLLEEKNSYIEKYYDKSLDDLKLYISIFGGLITVLFTGFGIITYKNSDKEIKIIKENIELETRIMIEKLINENKNLSDVLERRLLEEQVDFKNSVSKEIKQRVDNNYSSLKDEIKILNVKLIDSNINYNSALFPMYDCYELVKNAKGVFEVEYRISEVLDKIEEALDKGKVFDSYELENFSWLIDEVPSKFNIQKDRIIKKVKEN